MLVEYGGEEEEEEERNAIREISEGRKNTEIQEGKGLFGVLRISNNISPMLFEVENIQTL